MKITTKEIVDENNLLGHIILNSIGKFPTICDTIAKKGHGELKMTIDDIEINIESFVNHWQSDVDRIIVDKAKELVDDQMRELQDTIYEFSNAVQTKIADIYNNKK